MAWSSGYVRSMIGLTVPASNIEISLATSGGWNGLHENVKPMRWRPTRRVAAPSSSDWARVPVLPPTQV